MISPQIEHIYVSILRYLPQNNIYRRGRHCL